MNILMVTTKSPFPLVEGRALRTFNLLRQLTRQHRVILCTYVQTPEELAGVETLRSVCAAVHVVPLYLGGGRWSLLRDAVRELFGRAPLLAVKYRTRAMLDLVRSIVAAENIDVVHLDMLHLGELAAACRPVPVVLTEHNVESVLLSRRCEAETSTARRAYLAYQTRKLRAYEARLCAAVKEVVTVSDVDAEQLRQLCPAGRYTVIPNGVDTGYFRSAGVQHRPASLVYVGGLTWFPNLDAMRHFCGAILPRIREQVPEATLTIVGKLPDVRTFAEFEEIPGVSLVGLVDDVRPFIDAAAAYVVPLRIGGGTRLKILDALAMGQAIISTRVGAEGLAVESGRHLLLADAPTDFAAEVVRVLRDRVLATSLGQAGRALIEQRYDWSIVARGLDSLYLSAVEVPRNPVCAGRD